VQLSGVVWADELGLHTCQQSFAHMLCKLMGLADPKFISTINSSLRVYASYRLLVQGPFPALLPSSARLLVDLCSVPAHPGSIGVKMASFRHLSVVSRRICISDVILSLLLSSRCHICVCHPRGTAMRSSHWKFRLCNCTQSYRIPDMSMSLQFWSNFCGVSSVG